MSEAATTKWTLTYFDLYGRAEACRMALSHGKVDFVDNRVSGESWMAFKNSGKCANGQLPVLEVEGGHCLNQSEAIIRFIGRKTGAYPIDDAIACHKADAIINTFTDFENRSTKDANGKPFLYKMFGKDAMSEADLEVLLTDRKKWYDGMTKLLGESKYFGGDVAPSIADFWICASIYSYERNTKGNAVQNHVYAAHNEAFKEQTKLTAWADRMADELKDYLANRGSGSL